jgi:hypothetical protein
VLDYFMFLFYSHQLVGLLELEEWFLQMMELL